MRRDRFFADDSYDCLVFSLMVSISRGEVQQLCLMMTVCILFVGYIL